MSLHWVQALDKALGAMAAINWLLRFTCRDCLGARAFSGPEFFFLLLGLARLFCCVVLGFWLGRSPSPSVPPVGRSVAPVGRSDGWSVGGSVGPSVSP